MDEREELVELEEEIEIPEDIEIPDTAEGRRSLWLDLKRTEKRLKTKLEQLSDSLVILSPLVVEDMQQEEMDSIKLTGGITIYINKETYARVTDKEHLVDVFEEQGLRDMLTVNSQTLSSFVREKLEEAKNTPDEGKLPPWLAAVVEPSNRFSPRVRGLKI